MERERHFFSHSDSIPHLFYLLVPGTESDDAAYQQNSEALSKELQRGKPRKDVVLSLTRQTFPVRRACVLSNAEDVSVQSLLCDYPELKKGYVVGCQVVTVLKHNFSASFFGQLEQEIDLILGKRGVFAAALQDWKMK